MITIQAAKKSGLMGWFVPEKVWGVSKGDDAKKTEDNYEINISAEYLNRSVDEIIETLNHEMVHYFNKLSEIADSPAFFLPGT